MNKEDQILKILTEQQTELREFRKELNEQRNELFGQRTELREQGNTLRQELREQGNSLRQELHEQGNALRQELHEQGNTFRKELNESTKAILSLITNQNKFMADNFDTLKNQYNSLKGNLTDLTIHVKRVTHNHETRITRLEKTAA